MAVAVAPAIEIAEPLLPKEDFILFPTARPTRIVHFKISREFLEDKTAFESVLRKHKADAAVNGGELVNYEVGWENDDFVKDVLTVVLRFI